MSPRWVLALATGLLLIAATRWTAGHWVFLAAGGVLLAATGLVLWHRRRMAELREMHNVVVGRYRRVGVVAWPKMCRYCGATVHDWRACEAHDGQWSACAAFTEYAGRAGMAPKEPAGEDWQAYEDAPAATDKDRV